MKVSKRFLFLFVPLFIASASLAYVLSDGISSKYEEVERVKGVDMQVIHRLKQIRELQLVYMEAKHEYADNWDSLIHFVETEELHMVSRKEEVISRTYGGDSIVVTYDTLGTQQAFDVVHGKTGLTRKELAEIMLVPISKDTFSIYANRLEGAWVFEIKDEHPLNPKRQKNGSSKPLRLGSRLQATTKGNWE